MGYNLCILEGRLTRDPEVRQVGQDNAVASFTVAVDRDIKDKDGNRQADFINCNAWGKKAEFVANYFHKGDGIHLDGRIQVRKYQDKDGNPRTATDINVNNISFPPSNKTMGQGGGGSYQNNGGFNGGNSFGGNNGGFSQNNGGFNQQGGNYGGNSFGGGNQFNQVNNNPVFTDDISDGDLPF